MQTKYKVSRVLPEHISVKFKTTESKIEHNIIFFITIYTDKSYYNRMEFCNIKLFKLETNVEFAKI